VSREPTQPEPAGRVARPRKPARGALIALVGVAVLAVVALSAIGRSEFYSTYICARCGAEETVDRLSIAGVTYHEDAAVRETPVSRALTAREKQSCRHQWYLTRFARSGGSLFEWKWHADGGMAFSAMRMMLDDESFAHELDGMPHPREVWETLSQAEQTSQEQTEALVGDWYFFEGPHRQPFAQWWASNEKRVRQLGSGSPSRE
jgi:hypothetical protein